MASWVVAVSTGGAFGHCWGRNGEFCIAVGPTTRTAGILAEVSQRRSLLIWAYHQADMGCMLAQLGVTLARSRHQGWAPLLQTSLSVHKSSSFVLKWLENERRWYCYCLVFNIPQGVCLSSNIRVLSRNCRNVRVWQFFPLVCYKVFIIGIIHNRLCHPWDACHTLITGVCWSPSSRHHLAFSSFFSLIVCMHDNAYSYGREFCVVHNGVIFRLQVDENMKTAHKRDAVLNEKFYFRKDLTTCEWRRNTSLIYFCFELICNQTE